MTDEQIRAELVVLTDEQLAEIISSADNFRDRTRREQLALEELDRRGLMR